MSKTTTGNTTPAPPTYIYPEVGMSSRKRKKTYSCWWYEDDPKHKYVYEPGTVGHWLELKTDWVDDVIAFVDNAFVGALEWWRNLPGFRKLSDDTCACIAYTAFVGIPTLIMVALTL